MKKKLAIIMPIIIIVLIGTAFAVHSIFPPTTYLSQNEIDQLRELYPINDKQPKNLDLLPTTFEENIAICNCYIEAEIISQPTEYVKEISIDPQSPEGALHAKAGGLTEFTFVKYNVRILNDIFDTIQNNTIEITYNKAFDVGMPTMDIGTKFIIGGVYATNTNMIDIGSETIFYVTDDDYVLSVKSETTRNRHSGIKTKDFFNYLQTIKENESSVK